MTTQQGFSLLEVLLTLVFISGTALGLLTQQWQTARVLNTSLHDSHRLMVRDNADERSRVL